MTAIPAPRERRSSSGVRYRLFAPEDSRVKRIVVAVHGVSRNWLEHEQSFLPSCIASGAALVVPRFGRSKDRGYQRLSKGRRRQGAGDTLVEILDSVRGELTSDGELPVCLFGFSGGAQFAHRFVLSHPGSVESLALCSAGFYTLPTPHRTYPYGLGATRNRGPFCATALALPILVLVGERDIERDEELRTGEELDRSQGLHRVERARRFVVAVRSAVAASGQVPDCRLEYLAGCGHSFGQCVESGALVARVVGFFNEIASKRSLAPC